MSSAYKSLSPTRDRIIGLLKEGLSDEEIMSVVWGRRSGNFTQCRQAIALAKQFLELENEGGPLRRTGPWPVSCVRSNGERVFRVGAGHDIPEGSLAAFGFRPGKDGQR